MSPNKSIFISQTLLLLITFLFLAALKLYSMQNPSDVEAHLYAGYSVLDHAIPIPPGGGTWVRIPCDQIYDPEFHTLRPYQASPCGDSPKAYFCWNNYKIIEELPNKWDPGRCHPEGGYWLCEPIPPNDEVEKIYTVDGEYAKFPIMGNTENVANSKDPGDTFGDPQKVNEYVSWYLNGTIGRAEYPPMDTIEPNKSNKVVNYAGPLNKMLPLAYSDAYRISTIDEATLTSETSDPETAAPLGAKPLHHNQIVVCAKHLIDLGAGLEFGPVTAHPCYPTGGINPADPDIYRLKPPSADQPGDFKGWGNANLSSLNSITNIFGGDVWNKRKPPLPWGVDQEGKQMSVTKYWKYYNEWRGRSCLLVPFLNWFFCIENPLVTNEYADLFPYVPLANTSDKNALHIVWGVQLQPNAGTVAYYKQPPDEDPKPPATSEQLDGDNPDIVHNPVLFYPHTEETASEAAYLNKTFNPKETDSGEETPSEPVVVQKDYEDNQCEIIDVRSNPGDKLFQSSKDSRIDDLSVYVDVQIDYIGCPAGPIDSWIEDCGCNWPSDCPTRKNCELQNCKLISQGGTCVSCGPYPGKCRSYPDCSGQLTFDIPTTPKIPYANEIRKETVVGPESTFRRIFPKVIDEEGNPVRCIADIPGVSGTQYVPLPNPGYTNLVSIDTPTGIKTPSGSAGLISSELYFPYQGTIYEYFLRGIQTALRPKGFGHPIPQGTKCEEQLTGGQCKMWLFEKDPSGQYYFDKIIAAAGQTKCNGQSLSPFWAIAIALNEDGGLLSDDPIGKGSAHFGCNVTTPPLTIEDKLSCMLNTLQGDCGKTIEQTLSEYGYPPGYNMGPLSVLMGGVTNPPYPPLWGSGFNVSQLLANLLSTNWPAYYPNAPSIFCPNSPVLVPPEVLNLP